MQESPLIPSCDILLKQAVALLERIDDDTYRATSAVAPRSGIGVHIRHILDFYQCFFSGLQNGHIDYSVRERAAKTEHDRSEALERIAQTMRRLRTLPAAHAQVLVKLESADQWCNSSVLRELEFLHSHTIHHYSLIAMLLRLQGLLADAEFGVAPSTLEFWRQEAACAR